MSGTPRSLTGLMRGLYERLIGSSVVDGHLATARHGHVHRHLGELWFVSESNDITQGESLDVVIENPAGSGNVVEIILWAVTTDNAGTVTAWRGATFSGTATAIDPVNYDEDVTTEPDFNAQTGVDIIDIQNDTRLPGAAYTDGSIGNAVEGTAATTPGLDFLISEDSTFALHIEAAANITPLTAITIAEYEAGRAIVP